MCRPMHIVSLSRHAYIVFIELLDNFYLSTVHLLIQVCIANKYMQQFIYASALVANFKY